MKKIFQIMMIILALGVVIFCGSRLLAARQGYQASRDVYEDAASQFTKPAVSGGRENVPQAGGDHSYTYSEANERDSELDQPPITVDFKSLASVSDNVIGWIYCEDTVINYPIVCGVDNEYYLERDYRGNFDPGGSIFSDAANIKGFVDSNIILYGHHMPDMSMFATLKYWQDQDYYNKHPVMWILTPEQNYRMELFSAYPTSAISDTYSIFRSPGPELEQYLQFVVNNSTIRTSVELDPYAKYVVLSTCAYRDEIARTVLHGKLVPADAAPISKG